MNAACDRSGGVNVLPPPQNLGLLSMLSCVLRLRMFGMSTESPSFAHTYLPYIERVGTLHTKGTLRKEWLHGGRSCCVSISPPRELNELH